MSELLLSDPKNYKLSRKGKSVNKKQDTKRDQDPAYKTKGSQRSKFIKSVVKNSPTVSKNRQKVAEDFFGPS